MNGKIAFVFGAMLILSIVFVSGCAEKDTKTQTVMATFDSLPSGASVFIKSRQNADQSLEYLGVTPLKAELKKEQEYTVLMVYLIEEYRNVTRGIPEIQDRLDDFQRNEKNGVILPGREFFFERYTDSITVLSSGGSPNILQGVGIESSIYVFPLYKGKMRIANVFVPVNMNPDVLLPLADKSKHYNIPKADIASIMKQNNAPERLVDRTHNLLTKAGVALVVYVGEPLSDGTPQKVILHITTPDTDDDSKFTSVTVHTTNLGMVPGSYS